MPLYDRPKKAKTFSKDHIKDAVEFLTKAKNPGIYVGWGAVDAIKYTIELAEHLSAPVCTTLQGKSAFPASHPLHTGFGFGTNAVPVITSYSIHYTKLYELLSAVRPSPSDIRTR